MVGWRKLKDQDIRCMEDEEALRWRMLKRKHQDMEETAMETQSNQLLTSWIWHDGEAAGFQTDKALYAGQC